MSLWALCDAMLGLGLFDNTYGDSVSKKGRRAMLVHVLASTCLILLHKDNLGLPIHPEAILGARIGPKAVARRRQDASRRWDVPPPSHPTSLVPNCPFLSWLRPVLFRPALPGLVFSSFLFHSLVFLSTILSCLHMWLLNPAYLTHQGRAFKKEKGRVGLPRKD